MKTADCSFYRHQADINKRIGNVWNFYLAETTLVGRAPGFSNGGIGSHQFVQHGPHNMVFFPWFHLIIQRDDSECGFSVRYTSTKLMNGCMALFFDTDVSYYIHLVEHMFYHWSRNLPCLTHWGRVTSSTYECIGSDNGILVPSHYMNWCWFIVNFIFLNTFPCNFDRNTAIFIGESSFKNVVCKDCSHHVTASSCQCIIVTLKSVKPFITCSWNKTGLHRLWYVIVLLPTYISLPSCFRRKETP